EVSGFTAIKATGNTTTIARLDFVGSDNGGENVKNNFVIPMSYGVLKTRGAIEIKQLVYEGVHTVIHMQNVTELRYYETESFLRFIEVVVKVIAVVYLFYSWGEVTGAEFLWALATNIAAGVAIEYILTQIILHNPDNEAAVFVAVALATVAGAYLGTGVETAIDAALLGINAVSQVSTIYVEIKGDIIANNQSEFLQESAAKQEELDARFEEFHGNDNLLNFIKQTVISRVEPPDDFYARTLKSGVRDEMLDLAGRLDMENFFNKSVVIENTREG
ncbi:MAG: hypothetical protein GY829_15735, partial [Gammaproteobacteria bacterium]|nr:hypothetical protein [Gammaproteobacteria bacterium]